MKARELREMTAEEIRSQLEEQTAELSHLRFQHAVAPIQNPMILRQKRRDIARLKTMLQEKSNA